jgi:hypothetical protein
MTEVAAYRISDDALVVIPFKDDVELLAYLRLPDDALGRKIVAGYTPEHRYALARLRAIAECLNAGHIPRVALRRYVHAMSPAS